MIQTNMRLLQKVCERYIEKNLHGINDFCTKISFFHENSFFFFNLKVTGRSSICLLVHSSDGCEARTGPGQSQKLHLVSHMGARGPSTWVVF